MHRCMMFLSRADLAEVVRGLRIPEHRRATIEVELNDHLELEMPFGIMLPYFLLAAGFGAFGFASRAPESMKSASARTLEFGDGTQRW